MTGTAPDPVRVRLDLAYDGTDFRGWAVQPEQRTVAGVLSDALSRVVGNGWTGPGGLTVAGRTDAGVHATAQVCHLDLAAGQWYPVADRFVPRLNAVLPPDVRVTAATEVPPEFDARFSALARRYAYRVSDAPYGAGPLRRRDTLAWPRALDLRSLNAAAAGLVGEHEFAAYCRPNPNGTTVREIVRLDWRRDPDGVLVAAVVADAFCQSMVRSLVGAMLLSGDGRRPEGWPAALLARRERAGEVRVAPAHGLTLVGVDYPSGGPDQWAARARATRRVRTRAGQVPAGPGAG